MNIGPHFISYSIASTDQLASWLVSELEQPSRGLHCWFAGRDLSPESDPLEQIDEALRRCSSVIVILTDPTDSDYERSAAEWRRAISYNKPITLVREASGQACPLLLETRKLIDFSVGRDEALKSLLDRLLTLFTPAGQLEAMREQLVARRRASAYATGANRARFLSEITALEQQIATLVDAQQRERTVQERISIDLERERRTPTEKASEPVARLRVVNAPPLAVPRYFENRYIETGLIGDFLRDPAACILTVHGRGGVGKTALVCRVLQELEMDKLPNDGGALKVAGIVYVNATRASSSLYSQILSGLFLTLGKNAQDQIRSALENPNGTVATKLKELLPCLSPDPTVVLLDNFEDVLSPEDTRICDVELGELLRLLAELSRHSLKIVITTRVVPDEIVQISPVRQIRIALSDGLASPYAEKVLRKIDFDGSAGLRDAADATLSAVVVETRGFPRALEAFYSIIATDPTKGIDDVIADLRHAAHPTERITRALVGEAYSRLLPMYKEIMQVMAIYGRPVSITAIEFLLGERAALVDTGDYLDKSHGKTPPHIPLSVFAPCAPLYSGSSH